MYNESTFLGLMFQANIAEYELDSYAYITNTRYKYIVLKNESHKLLKMKAQLSLEPPS